MIALFFMNLTAALFIAAILLCYFSHLNAADSGLCFGIFYFGYIVIVLESLGLTQILTLNNVLLINLLTLSAAFFILRIRKPKLRFFDNLKDYFSFIFANKLNIFIVSVILVFAGVKLFVNLINPPFGWDSLNYHFTFPVEWLKHANLDTPITVFDEPGPTYYPVNGSLLYLWLMLPLKNVFLADLGQFPFFILSFLAVYSISKKIGLNRELSFFSASLFILIPNLFKQLQIAYVDLLVCGLFLICVNSLFLLSREFSWKNILIYGASLGLLLGTKTIALPYSLLLLLPFIYYWLKNIKKAHLLIFLILPVLTLGALSYFRNFLETQNPLYPLDLKLFGRSALKGVIDSSAYRAHFVPEDYRLSKVLFHEGLGLQSIVLILPGMLLALPLALLKKRRKISFGFAYLAILPVLTYLVYRFVIPLANTRYLYPVLGVGMILGFYLVKALNIPKFVTNILVVICVIVSMTELAKRQELIWATILTILLFLLLAFVFRPKNLSNVVRMPLYIGIFLILLISGLMLLERWYKNNESLRYLKMVKYSGFWPDAAIAWDWLNANINGHNIAYVGRPVPFPLYGSGFKNNVYYVSVNKTDPAKLHYFPDSRYQWGYDFESLHKSLEEENNYRGQADYSIWLGNLMKRKTDYLFVYSLHQIKAIEFPREDAWAKENRDRFTPVFTNDTIHIYKISR